jgi:hypothetical protein
MSFLSLPDDILNNILSYTESHEKYIFYCYLPESFRRRIQERKNPSHVYPLPKKWKIVNTKYLDYLVTFFGKQLLDYIRDNSFKNSIDVMSSYHNDINTFDWCYRKNLINKNNPTFLQNFIKSHSLKSVNYALHINLAYDIESFTTACNIGNLDILELLISKYHFSSCIPEKFIIDGINNAVMIGRFNIMFYLDSLTNGKCFDKIDPSYLAVWIANYNVDYLNWLWKKKRIRWTRHGIDRYIVHKEGHYPILNHIQIHHIYSYLE